MDYMLMFYEPDTVFAERNQPGKAEPYWGAWQAYVGAMYGAGIVKAGAGLEPPTKASSIRLRDGKRHVQDGPIADTKEQLGGYFVIDVPDLETALTWASRSPAAACGGVEVRPLMPPMPQ